MRDLPVEMEEKPKQNMIRSRIHCKAHRNKPLSEFKQAVNTRRSRVRARAGHIFGHQENSMGGTQLAQHRDYPGEDKNRPEKSGL